LNKPLLDPAGLCGLVKAGLQSPNLARKPTATGAGQLSALPASAEQSTAQGRNSVTAEQNLGGKPFEYFCRVQSPPS